MELEVSANPVSTLQINATMAWFDFKSGVTQPTLTVRPTSVTSIRVTRCRPSCRVSLGAQYTFHLGERHIDAAG